MATQIRMLTSKPAHKIYLVLAIEEGHFQVDLQEIMESGKTELKEDIMPSIISLNKIRIWMNNNGKTLQKKEPEDPDNLIARYI